VRENGRFSRRRRGPALKRNSVLAGGLLALLLALGLPVIAQGLVRTPPSGPLSKKPTIKARHKPAPKRLVVKDLVKAAGPKAKNGEALTVNYLGAFYRNGKVFDSSWRRGEPFTFRLGQGELIAGWERGLRGMRVGERRELIIPAALAYGRKGSPPSIPPNATLIYVVDLLAA
jgi:FKBP-type peptidyl-prolyl cis-trans isomerase